MAKGLSIHIGLNHVDPAQYEGWDGALNACVADAKDMHALAQKRGFKENLLLLDEEATAGAVSGPPRHQRVDRQAADRLRERALQVHGGRRSV